MRYIVVESFCYDVEADTPAEARQLFYTYIENGRDFTWDAETGVSYLENVTTIENEEGEKLL